MKTKYGKHIQLWPGGEGVEILGNSGCDDLRVKTKKGWRKPSPDLANKIRVETLAEGYLEHEVLCCDSALVCDLLRSEFEGFCIDNMINETPNPDKWDAETCMTYLEDHGIDHEDVTDGDALRDLVRDNAEPNEVFEWWRVTGWLARKLGEQGEVILDNDYGCWWGRGCTGQAIIMDGTLQEVAKAKTRQ